MAYVKIWGKRKQDVLCVEKMPLEQLGKSWVKLTTKFVHHLHFKIKFSTLKHALELSPLSSYPPGLFTYYVKQTQAIASVMTN